MPCLYGTVMVHFTCQASSATGLVMSNRNLQYYRDVVETLEEKLRSNTGRLPAFEWWRLNYCRIPFLHFETDIELTQRAYDSANCLQYLGESGKIEARSPKDPFWSGVWQTFQEANEEMMRRRLDRREIIGERQQLARYFDNGDPVGVKLLQGLIFPPFEKLLKFSLNNYTREMLKFGRFQISPASSYDSPAYNVAMADMEIQRSYRHSLISEYMSGEEFIELKRKRIPVSQGYIPINFPLPDYYMFSTCGAPERRMATDFQSDSALLIHRPGEFARRMKCALLDLYPTWQFLSQPVKYYDRYKDLPTDQNQEFFKEFAFAYQVEHRIVLRPSGVRHYSKLEPFFVELGSLSDIAELLE